MRMIDMTVEESVVDYFKLMGLEGLRKTMKYLSPATRSADLPNAYVSDKRAVCLSSYFFFSLPQEIYP
jgi:hypothetical protein